MKRMKVLRGMWLMCLMAFGTVAGWAADGVKVTITYAKDGESGPTEE